MKKIITYLPLLLFCLFIGGFSAANLFLPHREFSEMENRYLAEAPKFTFRSFFDNSFSQNFEKYTNDQFAGRDTWITLKSLSESALGKLENNGIVYGKDGYLFEKLADVSERQLQKNITAIQTFQQHLPGQTVRFAIVPSSSQILSDKLPKGLPNIDQGTYIQQLYAQAAEAGVQTWDVAAALQSEDKDSLYYRTDHHWTTTGAYYAYASFVRSLGQEPVDVQELTANHVPDFLGTYYSKAKRYGTVSDEILWYDVPVESVQIDDASVEGLYDLAVFQERDKYAAFLYGNNGVTVIKSDVNRYKEDGKTSRMLLFKDSFGNSFAPFLLYHFDEVVVVDLRYFSDVESLMEERQYDEILILYNFGNFSTDVHISKFGYGAAGGATQS